MIARIITKPQFSHTLLKFDRLSAKISTCTVTYKSGFQNVHTSDIKTSEH